MKFRKRSQTEEAIVIAMTILWILACIASCLAPTP
jgi:hypothetical protein